MNLVSDDVYSVSKVEILYRFNTETRYHREYRPMNGIILYVKGGHIRKMASGEEFRSAENDLLYLPYGSSYTSYLLEKGTEYYEINFRVEVNGEPRSLFDDFLVLHSPESDSFQPIFKEVFSLAIAPKPGSRAAIAGLIFKLVSMLEEGHSKDTDLSSSLSRIQFTVNYIQEHFSENTSVEELASLSHSSVSSLEKNFMRCFGMSPVGYRNDIRIHHAKLLLTGGFSIEETAYRVGFKDYYYFSKVFKKSTGESPGQYIRRKKTERK